MLYNPCYRRCYQVSYADEHNEPKEARKCRNKNVIYIGEGLKYHIGCKLCHIHSLIALLYILFVLKSAFEFESVQSLLLSRFKRKIFKPNCKKAENGKSKR